MADEPVVTQCPWCRGEIDPAAVVCPHCQAVKGKDGWRSADQMARNRITGIVLGVVAVALVLGIGWMVWERRQADNKQQVEQKMEQVQACIDAAGSGRPKPDFCA